LAFQLGIIPAPTGAVHTWKSGIFSKAKTAIRFFPGLCLICCLLFQVLSACGVPVGGITTASTLTLTGNNTIDSYDSSDPTYSLWHSNWWFQGHNFGTYTNTLRSDQVVVGTDLLFLSLNGGDVVYGYVDTGPGGSVIFKGNGNSVGDLAWVGVGNPGIELGHQRADMNVVFNDVVGPTPTNSLYNVTTGWPNGRWLAPAYFPSGTNISGINYYYLVTNVAGLTTSPSNKIYYALPSIANSNASIFLGASNCVLFLTNGISMPVGYNLTVDATNNANVELYTGGTFDTGNGFVNNAYQYAPLLKIYGLRTCTSIVFRAYSGLAALVYAPEADVTFYGGGSSPVDISGAFIVHSIVLKGHFNFHADQAFQTNVPSPPWIISSPSNQFAQLGSNATIAFNVGGDSPLYYQWFLFDHTNKPVAADTNLFALTLTNVQFSDVGSYSVIVTNPYGSITSPFVYLNVYSNATPTLTIESSSSSGQFQFYISGVTGLHYSVEASSNLFDWEPLETNISSFTFVDTNSSAFPQRFYRSVFVP
jgi:hypothetical protein